MHNKAQRRVPRDKILGLPSLAYGFHKTAVLIETNHEKLRSLQPFLKGGQQKNYSFRI
jgi:hypothetical protein